ncbi:MAG TPA: CPCC family cysteine-rich protein [Anaerolineae bacterium]|nr:CPCC family cysteine-rich protein [Anaerolineae bacterium]HMR65145.1 CPCC family cysteine-rich protein [Anaerolineae bacterium]
MQREEALEKIAWYYLKKLSKDEALDLVVEFFEEPLKPSLREKLNLTAILQWETHSPPENLNPGNPIYRPILLEKMKAPFRGATNEYLAEHLRRVVGLQVDGVEGPLPTWLPCPVCGYHTLAVVGDWDTCPVCGWISDPVQEAIHDDPTGANGISLHQARQNFQKYGAISQAKATELDPDAKQRYPK